MHIFRKLRWKLTLNYTIVTVSAFFVALLVLVGIVFLNIFAPRNIFTPEVLIEVLQKNANPLLSHVLSQSPVDTELISLILKEPNSTITENNFLRFGSVQVTVRTIADWRALIIGTDGTLLGKSNFSFPESYVIGQPFDPSQIQGLEVPLTAALAGETDPKHLYTIFEPNQRYLLALPIFNYTPVSEYSVLGVIVFIFDSFPTNADIPSHILNISGKSLLIFLLSAGILGAIFGGFFAHGLSTRFKRVFTTIDAWSIGDFTKFIDDTTGDEIAQFSQRLNNMAKQLQELLRRRQDMAVSEERNRLARDLHDSAKQQALAASFQLGTALTLYDCDPQTAKKHLVEADALVDSVRNELTNLVHELRPQSLEGQDFPEALKEYAADWSLRNKIEMQINIEADSELSIETRETLFRIAQEALANIARHSAASHAEISLEYVTNMVTMTIKDNGHGFDKSLQHPGLGLYSMQERAENVGGSLTIESSVEQGTKIVAALPRIAL